LKQSDRQDNSKIIIADAMAEFNEQVRFDKN